MTAKSAPAVTRPAVLRYLTRDRAAIAAALAAPPAAAAVLLPARASWPNTNVALLLVVVVVAVAAIGNRAAGALAAVSAAAWFDFFFTRPYERFTIRGSADVTTAVLLLAVGVAVSQLAAGPGGCGSSRSPMRATSRRSARPRRWPPRRRVPATSGSSSPGCWAWTASGSSTAPCSGTRRAWSRTAP